MENNENNTNKANKGKRLAIIGAGISGIVSAKYALENGFSDISIFDTKKSLGGNWYDDKNSPMWDHLKTNVSKYIMMFSDFVWQEQDENFNDKKEVINFLEKYATHFKIHKYLKLETKVLHVSRIINERENNNEIYKIQIKHKEEEIKTLEFDYVIVCSGFLSIPDYTVFERFRTPESKCKVEIIHATNFKNADKFKDKRVIVIGQAHSSTQIATKISRVAKDLINIFRKPSHVLPKRLYVEKYNKQIPFDLELFKFKVETEEENIAFTNIPDSVIHKKKNNFMKSIAFPDYNGKGNKNNTFFNDLPEYLIVEDDCEIPLTIGISDGYYKGIKKGFINAIRSEIIDIQGNRVYLKNGDILEDIDYIVLGTGYKCNLYFLDEDLRKNLNYQVDNKYGPINTILDVFNPSIKNMAFVGIHYFPIFGKYELQAKLAFKYFSDSDYLTIIKKDLCFSGLSHNKPYSFIEYINKIAMLLDSYPKLDEIKKEDEELYQYITEGPLFIQIFFLNTENKKKYSDIIKSINRALNSDNFLN